VQEVARVDSGDLCVVAGLQNTITGDTLCESSAVCTRAAHAYEQAGMTEKNEYDGVQLIRNDDDGHKDKSSTTAHRLVLQGIERPSRVYYCSIEAPSLSAQQAFDRALCQLCIDDPSLVVRYDGDTQQMVIEACGELHVEIVKVSMHTVVYTLGAHAQERLRRQHNLDVFIGRLLINYRETIGDDEYQVSRARVLPQQVYSTHTN
jgi:elongation factor G